jgi:hypothetical protein
LTVPLSKRAFSPASYTVASSGPANLDPEFRLVNPRPLALIAFMSAAKGRESRDRFHDDALKPVAAAAYPLALFVAS